MSDEDDAFGVHTRHLYTQQALEIERLRAEVDRLTAELHRIKCEPDDT